MAAADERGPVKSIVTGALGFVGPCLVEALLRSGETVVGLDLPRPAGDLPARRGGFGLEGPTRDPGGARYAGPAGAWDCVLQPLEDTAALAAVIARVRPQAVYHLAAHSSAAASFADPRRVVLENLAGGLSLLEVVRQLPGADRPVVVVAGTAEEYGTGAGGGPCRETDPVLPASPYAVSKAAQTMLCRQYHRAWEVPVIVARPFSHTGPGQDRRFVFPSFAAQIAAAERGEQPAELRVGNLDARRDFLDVRDVVAAYQALRRHGRPGEVYNICSGRALTIRDGLEILLGAARLPVAVRQDPERMRPVDVPNLVGDPEKLHQATGWTPVHDIANTLGEILEYARRQEA
jgi:GDP-4-dehydro-6-deoxy-D-mannose reductase